MAGYTVIYEPKGAAREYAELACNLRLGCTHRCDYCYAPGVLHMAPEQFHRAVPARSNIVETLSLDAAQMARAGDRRRVLFSFVGDPYDGAEAGLTREALKVMVAHGLRFAVLTKGGTRAVRDFDLIRQGGDFGTSLVWCKEADVSLHEPGTASGHDRLTAIRGAVGHGIHTWASVEPVIDPVAGFGAIHALANHGCQEFRIGIRRGDGGRHDWVGWCQRVVDYLGERGLPYQIKASLRPYWPDGVATDTREVSGE